MSDLEKLARAIRREYSSAEIRLDTPIGAQHPTWLDVEYQGRSVAVEWRSGIGFGVSLLPETSSDPMEGLFQGPDQVFEDWMRVKDYVFGLLAAATPLQSRVKQFAGG